MTGTTLPDRMRAAADAIAEANALYGYQPDFGLWNPVTLRKEAERLEDELVSWDFLMALLNVHYPDDVFPTMEDRPDRDPGPRIVSLIRHLDAARSEVGS